MFDLHRLELLCELRRRGTIRAVAAALHYSPSTVSQQLALLQQEAGVPLLEGVGRRVQLTAQGEMLADQAEVVIRTLETLRLELAESVDVPTGTVRIAAFQSVLLALGPGLLADLRERFPGVRVHLVQAEPEDAIPALASHDLDIVLAEQYPGQALPQHPALRYHEMGADELVLAVPEQASGAAPGAVHGWDLVRDRLWAMEPVGTASRRWLTNLCRSAGFEPDVRFETHDLLVQHRLVAAGEAVAVLPGLLLDTVGHDGIDRVALPGGGGRRRMVTVVDKGSANRPAVSACLDGLRRAFREPGGAPRPGPGSAATR